MRKVRKMKANASTNKRVAAAFASAALAALLAGVVGFSQADGAMRVDGAYASVGEDGKVYGVPHENDYGETVMPDMMRVRATNGVYGYVDNRSQAFAVLGYPETQEEMSSAIAANSEKKASALRDAFAEYFGVDLLSHEQGYEVGRILTKSNGHANAQAYVTEHTRDGLLVAMREGRLSSNGAAALVAHAIERGAIPLEEIQSLPGVEAGKLASAVESVQTDAAGVADYSDAVVSAEDISAADNQDEIILRAAEAFVADQGAWRIEAESLEVGGSAFYEIYESAQAKTAVSVPVYASDGETVVGEYMINIM